MKDAKTTALQKMVERTDELTHDKLHLKERADLYQMVWNDHKKWLEGSVSYLNQRMNETTGMEQERIKNKLEGMTVSLQNVLQAEKIFDLDRYEQEEQ